MTSLVERYAEPIRTRCTNSPTGAEPAHRTQAELLAAATTVADQRDRLKDRIGRGDSALGRARRPSGRSSVQHRDRAR